VTLDAASAVNQLIRMGFDRADAERQVRAQLGVPRPPDPETSDSELNALEKQ
jgi:hypothetical protein